MPTGRLSERSFIIFHRLFRHYTSVHGTQGRNVDLAIQSMTNQTFAVLVLDLYWQLRRCSAPICRRKLRSTISVCVCVYSVSVSALKQLNCFAELSTALKREFKP